MAAAYILWFFLGGLSAHRFYLGFTTSAIIQALLAPMAYMMMLGASLGLGLICLIVAWIWILSDVFTIPGMLRQANERVSRQSVHTVFA
ncbi:MAG: NINE protein [Sphingosinicella sp.]|uniref:NINE protein n=1 Tax=Sphingosinicella sp. TaxID=1917971 RepID=UPI0040381F7B